MGLFLRMAVLSRQATILHVPFFSVLLWKTHTNDASKQAALKNILKFLGILGFFIGSYLTMNWLRFGNPLDTGYAYIPLGGFLKERVDQYGLFNLAYVPFNAIHMFLQGFRVEFRPPLFLDVCWTHLFGTSITFTSPFLFAAFWAKWDKGFVRAVWVSVGLVLTLILLYYNNGWTQYNAQRFSLDFLPVLILLTALGMARIDEKLWKGAIVYSVGLNVIALVLVPILGWISTHL